MAMKRDYNCAEVRAMQMPDHDRIRDGYAEKSDDELLMLASEYEGLTVEAKQLLAAELAKRQLGQAERQEYAKHTAKAEEGFVYEFDAKNNVLRGTIAKDRPETARLSDEIMKLLIKRQTSLADGCDALTTVVLNALKANYGGARANELDLLLSHYSEEVRKFSESMKPDRFCIISNEKFAEWIERDRVSMDQQASRRLRSVSVKQLWHRTGQALARAGTNLRNKLGLGGGLQGTMVDKERPERVRHLAIEISDLLNKRRPNLGYAVDALNSVMLTAIEATHGREKANEYDLLNARFSKEVRTFWGERVQ
jgi:hypothetical protein